MPTPPILDADAMDWTYEDVADELEQLAMMADVEPPGGPSLTDLPQLVYGEIARIAEDLERVAELEAR